RRFLRTADHQEHLGPNAQSGRVRFLDGILTSLPLYQWMPFLKHARPTRRETLAFALLAVVPLIPYLLVLFPSVPRYTSIADFALIEQHVRHVSVGETLLGLKSRYDWHHPGPLFFYCVAPFTVAFGRTSTGLYVGSWALVALGFAWLVALT